MAYEILDWLNVQILPVFSYLLPGFFVVVVKSERRLTPTTFQYLYSSTVESHLSGLRAWLDPKEGDIIGHTKC